MQAIVGGISMLPAPILESMVRTSISRLASGFIRMYWVMFPSGIHGVMMETGNWVEISMMGSTFG